MHQENHIFLHDMDLGLQLRSHNGPIKTGIRHNFFLDREAEKNGKAINFTQRCVKQRADFLTRGKLLNLVAEWAYRIVCNPHLIGPK